MKFFTKSRLICWLLLGVIAGALYASYAFGPKLQRTLLYFQRNDGGLGIEERYLPQLPDRDFAVLLIDELLLGPIDHTFLHFSDPDTRPRSCFVRGGALYVDLPARVLTSRIKTSDFHTVYTLLRKNILLNCKNNHTLYVYIEGIPAYVNNSDHTAENKKS